MIRFEKVSYALLLVLIIWLPIPLASNRVWAWSIAEIMVAIQTLCLAVSYLPQERAFPFARLKRFSWLLVPLTLFQVWNAVQIIPLDLGLLAQISPATAEIYQVAGASQGALSLDVHASTTSLVKGITYTLLAFNAAILIHTPARLKTLAMTLVVSGTLQAFYGAMAVLLGWKYSLLFGFRESGIATASFVYKNHLANYLMMCLAVGSGLIVSQLHISPSGSWHERIRRWSDGLVSRKMFVRLALIIMVIALVMTRSRMGNTAFFAATTLGGVVALLFFKDKPRALVPLIVSLILVDTLVVGTVFGLDKVKDRLEQTSVLKETRDEVIQWSLPIVEEYPVTGTGMGSFYSIFPRYADFNIGFYDHAHNDYLQFAVEAGVPATAMLGLMWIWAVIIAIRSMRKRNSKTLRGLALGCLIALIGMLMHISVDFNLQAPANAMTFILILVMTGCTQSIKIARR
ncbi:O-antigen ligase family protein [Vibrio maerlii]|uniref:O-antigen ligase family protein n=1 Tax=Vibrio maerlii TaxID=2231648 RepID=UPI000E3E1C2E|nr:O-antigen ligase family protein [Vibrio maerlii]